jgi:hypothetical protein
LTAEEQFSSILGNGWRQGSIANQELVAAASLPIETSPKQYYLVVSHSCDLTNPKPDLEPFVEVLRADVTADGKDVAFTRSPRKIALVAKDAEGSDVPLLVRIETRQLVRRELLITNRPDPTLWLPDDAVKILAIWMSRRYRRPELPTELLNRIGGQKYDKFKKLGKKSGATFSRILISLSSWDELRKDQKYQAKIVGLLPPGPDIPQAAKEWATAVDTLLSNGVEGLEMELTQIESESDMQVSTLREYRILDLDFVSFAAGEFDLIADD